MSRSATLSSEEEGASGGSHGPLSVAVFVDWTAVDTRVVHRAKLRRYWLQAEYDGVVHKGWVKLTKWKRLPPANARSDASQPMEMSADVRFDLLDVVAYSKAILPPRKAITFPAVDPITTAGTLQATSTTDTSSAAFTFDRDMAPDDLLVIHGSVALSLTVSQLDVCEGRRKLALTRNESGDVMLTIYCRGCEDRDALFSFCETAQAAAVEKTFAQEDELAAAPAADSGRVDALLAAGRQVDMRPLVQSFSRPWDDDDPAVERQISLTPAAALKGAGSLLKRVKSSIAIRREAAAAQALLTRYGTIGPPPADGFVQLQFQDAVKPRRLVVPSGALLVSGTEPERFSRIVIAAANAKQAVTGVDSLVIDLLSPTTVAVDPKQPLGNRFILQQTLERPTVLPHGSAVAAVSRRQLTFIAKHAEERSKWLRWFAHALGRPEMLREAGDATLLVDREASADFSNTSFNFGSFRFAKWGEGEAASSDDDQAAEASEHPQANLPSLDATPAGGNSDQQPRGESRGLPESVERQDASQARWLRATETSATTDIATTPTTVVDRAVIAAREEEPAAASVSVPLSVSLDAAAEVSNPALAPARAAEPLLSWGVVTDVVGNHQYCGRIRLCPQTPENNDWRTIVGACSDGSVATFNVRDIASVTMTSGLAQALRVVMPPGSTDRLRSPLSRYCNELLFRVEHTSADTAKAWTAMIRSVKTL
jgi:hypothetical protein